MVKQLETLTSVVQGAPRYENCGSEEQCAFGGCCSAPQVTKIYGDVSGTSPSFPRGPAGLPGGSVQHPNTAVRWQRGNYMCIP
jgi:hypothetical protein